jgi:hypothetical protein
VARLLVVDVETGTLLVELAPPDNSRLCWSSLEGRGPGTHQLAVRDTALAVRCEATCGSGGQQPSSVPQEQQQASERAAGQGRLLVFDLAAAAAAAAGVVSCHAQRQPAAPALPGHWCRVDGAASAAVLLAPPQQAAACISADEAMAFVVARVGDAGAAADGTRQARSKRVCDGLTALAERLLGEGVGGGGQSPPLLLGSGL